MLHIANVDNARFTVLRQRRQLPFDPPKGENYTLDHAHRLSAMVRLCDSGVRPGLAKELVERGNGDAECVLAIIEGTT